MKIWVWLGLIPGWRPFLPRLSGSASWNVHGLFSIARRIFPSVHFQLSFCLFMCTVKVSPYLEHALNLHREQGAGREGRVVPQQLQPLQLEVCCFFFFFATCMKGWHTGPHKGPQTPPEPEETAEAPKAQSDRAVSPPAVASRCPSASLSFLGLHQPRPSSLPRGRMLTSASPLLSAEPPASSSSMPRCAGHDPLPLPARRILHPLHFSRERRETFRRGLAGSAPCPPLVSTSGPYLACQPLPLLAGT